MSLPGFRPLIALAFVAVVFGSLVGGRALLKERTVDEPLQRAYDSLDFVKQCQVIRRDNQIDIKILLRPVDDLRPVYLELEKKGKEVLGRTPFTITIEDDRTPQLSDAFYRMHFAIQEGIATGHFSAMNETIGRMAKPGVARWRVFVDERFVYVQLHDADGHSLYEIVKRTPIERAQSGDSGSESP